MRQAATLTAVIVVLALAASEAMAADAAREDSERCTDSDAAYLDTVQITATKRPESRMDVPVRAENLADRHCREHGSGLDEPGRNIILTVDYHC